MNKCDRRQCPTCGDWLIHQLHRGFRESSSAFGQWVHGIPHQFDFVDVDGLAYRRSTRVLYVIEEKHGSGLSAAQNGLLPILERAVDLLIADGSIDQRSRVLHLDGSYSQTDNGYQLDSATVKPQRWFGPFPVMTGDEIKDLLLGKRFLPEEDAA